MKKVLSLVLAVMLAVGMSTAAFAAPITKTVTFTAGDDLWFGTPDATATPPNSALTPVAAPAAGTVEVFAKDAFGDWSTTKMTSGYKVSKAPVVSADNKSIVVELQFVDAGEYKVGFDSTVALAVATYTPGADSSVPGTYAPAAAGTITPATQTITVSGTTPVDPVDPVDPDEDGIRIPTSAKIVGFTGKNFAAPKALTEAGQTSELKITADMFEWSDGVEYTAADEMRASHLKDIGVRRVYQKGTNGTIKSVELKDSKSLVEVKTVDFYTKTGSTDVELKVALTFKGSTKDAPEYTYDFTIANAKEWIEDGQTEAYSFGNIFLEADATVRNVTFQGDEDEQVFATKTVVKGQKYYFNVTTKLSSADEQIIADNPEVDSIYNVYHTNMANATVQFKNLDREFFVYDADGKFLGTTKDSKLPLASKYILTTAKVDFGTEEPVQEPVEEPTEPEAPPMGGGEVEAPVNNYNPNTGL